jgi:uncharacterized phage protein gp47/JayE
MSIEIKSFNQILGDMVRKIVADTPLNDINDGSVLLTLLEAAASNDFENNTAILNVLELLNIDALRNNDLDAKAADYGLSRRPAVRASGKVTIFNKNIQKRSTGFYVVKPAPIAGQTTIYVNNTSGWAPTGSIYIGRGTENFEGPINYTAINVFPTHSEIVLASALQKDHLISESVIDSQGEPDRIIPAGTVVKIPANNLTPEIRYSLIRDAVIPSGEDKVEDVEVIALSPGTAGNAGIGAISEFDTVPFLGAEVTNTTAFSNGKDVETDSELRNRLKSYASTLARGTAQSIISAVIGVSDQEDSKQVASAKISEPVKIGDPSLLYIDDGTGFQPSYKGQSVDILVNNAEGTEEFLQLSNFPLPRAMVINAASGPFTFLDGSFLRVAVDGKEETIYFENKHFVNISAATLVEVVSAINSQSVNFKALFTNSSKNIMLYAAKHDAETIQVLPLRASDDEAYYANSQLKFPTDEMSYITLYQNSVRLKEKQKSAELTTTPYAQWNITSASNLIISVDDTPEQDRLFTLSDFPGASSFSALSLEDWVEAFNRKFAGIIAEATPSQTMIIRSNKSGQASKLKIMGGTLLNKLFADLPIEAEGQTADFELNRQTGNLRILKPILPGDSISAGSEDTKGFIISSSSLSNLFNLAIDANGRAAEMVIVADSKYCNKKSVPLVLGTNITISSPDPQTMRIMIDSTESFAALKPGDYIYLVYRSTPGWLSIQNTGLYKIKAKGAHTNLGVDTYIDVSNDSTVPESGIQVQDVLDIKAFETDGYPQIWRGSYLINPPAASLIDIIDSLHKHVYNVKASIFKSNSIKLTSTSEKNGSIAIPVSIANASVLFQETQTAQFGNLPHVATKISNKDSAISYFKISNPIYGQNVFLSRVIYSDLYGSLPINVVPSSPPFTSTYSELLTTSLPPQSADYSDYVFMDKGSNKGQFRSIRDIINPVSFGTQQGIARTNIDYVSGDEIHLSRPLSISSDDSVIFVVDNDPATKTIDVKMSRTGIVNSGSGMTSFTPTTTEFSATDLDNEPGIDFSNLVVWSKTQNKTEFADYAVWMRARNWYATGGFAGTGGRMIVRASQFGPSGENLRFSIEYPTSPDQSPMYTYLNTPSWSKLSYFFGSGPARAIGLNNGDTISVMGPYPDASTNFPNGAPSTGEYYDYTFSAGNLSSVTIGDVVSINTVSGVSSANSGQFKIFNKSGFTIRVKNPNASLTSPGSPEIVTVTTIPDIVGSPTTFTITTVPDVGGSLHQTYFIIHDTAGSVAVWFDVDNVGAASPTHGASRAIKVATINTNDTAATVANKIAVMINTDSAFSATVLGNIITITNAQNGALPAALSGTSGFGVATTVGTNDISLDRRYFIIYDDNGSVAVWYDVGNDSSPEPFHGADRSIKVSGVMPGDSAATIAAATATAINLDPKFTATALGNVITITHTTNGNLPNANAGTSGFSVANTDGSNSTSELITNNSGISIFPITGTTVQDIMNTVNTSGIIEISPVSPVTSIIDVATREEDYSYSGNSTALAYDHNPTIIPSRGYISLFDGINWVKSFDNSNPNFTLKKTMTLNGVAPWVYELHTAPNHDIPDIGEVFKLVPTTIENVRHHLTQKALSQLPIVANVSVSNDRKNIQIVSKKLGSEGAIEVVGGNANSAKMYILNESEVVSDINGNKMLVKIQAFPDTFNAGDYVWVKNPKGVRRQSRLSASDTVDVVNPSPGIIEYKLNAKATNITATTQFTITDVSSVYMRPAGFVWRWTHSGSASFAQVKPGDILMAYGPTLSYAQGNKVGQNGAGQIAGFPIINVNDSLNYVDVINPFGKAMPTPTAVGAGNTVSIHPSNLIKWTLRHAARVKILSITRVSNIVTVTCEGPHRLNSGDNVDIRDSNNIPDGAYLNVTTISHSQFSFTLAGPNFTETNVGATVIKSGLVPTRYTVEKMGHNNLIKIKRVAGESPMFVDSGVAVDDVIVIKGETFKASNNGVFRVLGVTNDYIIIENKTGSEELNHIRLFNNKGLQAQWTANNNIITGVAGTFKNINVGDWIKKPEDPDSFYRQVLSMSPSSPSTATQIVIGGNYQGATSNSMGAAYDQASAYYGGVELKGLDDISVYEGDSTMDGDTLYIQNIVATGWFSQPNIGSFVISEVGVGADYRPYFKVNNSAGVAESNRSLSVDVNGFYVVESNKNKFKSLRVISHAALDDLNPERRSLYLYPHDRHYKFSNAYETMIEHAGKIGYISDITRGTDGYMYFTGLLRRVQRIIDGYEPDAQNFPGRRAVGGLIEIIPPIIKRVSLTINITTDEGVNLGEISNNIKSVIINYVNSLGVGQDVVLSEIIAAVMQIKGVYAATFTKPDPSTEKIAIANDEKAYITPDDIGLS